MSLTIDDDRLVRIEKILLGLEWAGVRIEAGGDESFRFCLLCGGFDPERYNRPNFSVGHLSGCLFLELAR